MQWKKIAWIVITLFFIILALLLWTSLLRVPEPKYTVLNSENEIEIREYPALVVAQVNVTGERDPAINQGFRFLADYIYGNNDKQQKIPMTAPVTQTETKDKNKWIISFFMPVNLPVKALPTPKNENVKLITIPAKKFVVIRFSGFNSETNIQAHIDEVMKYAEENNLRTVGTPIIAFYNPPWTLAFLRRNEVMFELVDYKPAAESQ